MPTGGFRNGLPNDYDAECAVVSSMLMDKGACMSALDMLNAPDFFSPVTRAAFEAISRLFSRDEHIDVVTLKDELARYGKLDLVGGVSGLAAIAGGVSTSVGLKTYAKTVKDTAKRREAIDYARSVEDAAYNAETVEQVAAKVAEPPALYGERKESGTLTILHDFVTSVVERFQDDGREYPGLPTGIDVLDKATDGLYPGELVFLCADPGVGKSLLLTQILVGAALKGLPVAYFNYELSDQQIGGRILANALPIEMRKLKYPRQYLRAEDFNVFRRSEIDTQLDPFLHIFSRTNKTAAEVRARCKELELRGKKPAIIGVDYIQLMRGKGREQREILEANSAALKSVAEAFECPVIAVSSLNRGNGGGKEKGLRNSGQLEYDAGRTILLERDHKNPSKAERCKTTVKMQKNRDGAASEFTLDFDEDYLRFS